MTTSNNTIFQLSRDEIINAAYRKLGVVSEGDTASAAQLTTGTQALNTIVAFFQTLGMALWARKELIITMVSGQQEYTIGVGKAIAQPFPLHVHEAVLNMGSTDSSIDVTMLARADFNLLPATDGGTPVNATYQPFINYGVFSVWPTPDTSLITGTTITITYTAPFEYFIAATDTMDFPQEWYLAVIYALTVVMAPDFGIPLMDRQQFSKEADSYLAAVLANGGEDASLFFSPGG